jgi:hypothetical protein
VKESQGVAMNMFSYGIPIDTNGMIPIRGRTLNGFSARRLFLENLIFVFI